MGLDELDELLVANLRDEEQALERLEGAAASVGEAVRS